MKNRAIDKGRDSYEKIDILKKALLFTIILLLIVPVSALSSCNGNNSEESTIDNIDGTWYYIGYYDIVDDVFISYSEDRVGDNMGFSEPPVLEISGDIATLSYGGDSEEFMKIDRESYSVYIYMEKRQGSYSLESGQMIVHKSDCDLIFSRNKEDEYSSNR